MILDNFDIPLIEMRCTCCKKTMQARVKSAEPFLTKCTHCQTYLVVELDIKQKVNNVLFSLVVTAVPKAEEKPEQSNQSAAALRMVV